MEVALRGFDLANADFSTADGLQLQLNIAAVV